MIEVDIPVLELRMTIDAREEFMTSILIVDSSKPSVVMTSEIFKDKIRASCLATFGFYRLPFGAQVSGISHDIFFTRIKTVSETGDFEEAITICRPANAFQQHIFGGLVVAQGAGATLQVGSQVQAQYRDQRLRVIAKASTGPVQYPGAEHAGTVDNQTQVSPPRLLYAVSPRA